MIPSPLMILAVVIAFVLNGFYWHSKGANSENTRWTAKISAERLAATEAARVKENQWQGVINATSKAYLTRITGIRGDLDAALDSLRSRPPRAGNLPDHPRADCAGATGAELSGPDAEFLAREAARADEQRAGLDACYAYADTLRR
jgi:hypothetical protein